MKKGAKIVHLSFLSCEFSARQNGSAHQFGSDERQAVECEAPHRVEAYHFSEWGA